MSRPARDDLSSPDSGAGCLAAADGRQHPRPVQVVTNAGALARDKQLPVISQLTAIVAAAAGDPSLADRTWALLTEAPDGGWVWPARPTAMPSSPRAARAEIASLQPRTGN
jgi:hypothetical protein